MLRLQRTVRPTSAEMVAQIGSFRYRFSDHDPPAAADISRLFCPCWWPHFEWCAVFAVIRGVMLYYLPIGDCRLAVCRGSALWLLNGSVWVDPGNNPLPPMITAQQEVQRGDEDPPSQALGVGPLNLL